MKKYSQFLKELPSKTVVFAFGRFNPPTTGHELLVKAVKKLAASNKADHAIYASKSQDAKKNPLTVDKKVHYLNLMFPNTHFVAASTDVPTFIQAAKQLNKKYKNIIMVAGSDRIPEYQRILNNYNGKEFHFDTIQVISAGERDPDSDDASGMSASKMRALASKGDFANFKRGLPTTMREIDSRRLMNDVRQGMGLEMVKEQLNLVKDELREQYFRGEIFNIGDIVEAAGIQYEIVKRGSNHLLLKEQSGKLVSKWIQDVILVEDVQPGYAPQEITFGGYTTKNLHHSEDAAKAFQETIARHGKDKPAAVLHALMATDTYMGLSDLHLNQGKDPSETEKEQWIKAHEHAKEHLDELGDFLHHRDYWDNHMHEMEDMLSKYEEEGAAEMNEELTDKTLKTQDKIKVARIIATMLGVDNAEGMSNPDQLVNLALRKVRTKALNAESISILHKMLQLATDVGIKYDSSLVPAKLKEAEEINKNSTYNAAKDRLRYKDYVKLSKMNKGVAEEDEETASDQTAQKAQQVAKVVNPHSVVGHSITHPLEDDSDRRQKIQYVSEESGAYEKAEENKRSAEAAKKQGDMFAHHLHMADHHDNLAQWHSEKGRHSVADTHARKSEEHHEKAMALKEETTPYWKKASWIKKMSAAAKQERLAREKKEREAQQPVKEDTQLEESSVEFRLDHREKVRGDHKSTFADHEAKVGDVTDKATYINVPSHKATAFKNAMKAKHGVKVELAESVLSEDLHSAIAKHLDKHISDFKSGHTGMDQFGSKVLDAHKKIAQAHGIDHKDAVKHVNAYVDRKLNEEAELEEATDMATLRQKLNKHTELAVKANRAGNDEEVKKHQVHINKIKDKMAKLVREESEVCPICKKDPCECEETVNAPVAGTTVTSGKPFDPFFKEEAVDMSEYEDNYTNNLEGEDISDEELDAMADEIEDIDDVMDAYEDDEFSIVDDETGEELEPDDEEENKLEESALNEVLSRIERMKAKQRIRRTKAKRERATKIALKRYSGTATINKRARRLAVKLMKKRLLRGRDAAKISVGEKERIERVLERRRKVIGRLAMRLAPRVRKIEKARMSHSKFTAPAPAVGM